MWNLLLGPVVKGVTNYFTNKQRITQAKVDGEVAVLKQASQNVSEWEKVHAKGSQTSWKDEFWTIIFAVPLVMGFIPGMKVYADAGFEALTTMPEWYQYTLVTMVLASFGIRVTSTVKNMLGK